MILAVENSHKFTTPFEGSLWESSMHFFALHNSAYSQVHGQLYYVDFVTTSEHYATSLSRLSKSTSHLTCPASQHLLATYPLAEQNTIPCFHTAWAEHVRISCIVLGCMAKQYAIWVLTTSHNPNQSQSTRRFVSFSNSIRNQTTWLFLGPPHRWNICRIL